MPIIVSNLVGSIRFVSSLDSTLSHIPISKVFKDTAKNFAFDISFHPFLEDGCNKRLKKNDLLSENHFSNSQ